MSLNGAKTVVIALFTQMSIGPKASSTAAAAELTASQSATSTGSTSARPPASSTSRRAASSPSRPRAISDGGGRRLGAHPGQHLFTVGQRKGLGLAAGEPLYVLAKDAGANTVTVGTASELGTRRVSVRSAVLHRAAGTVDRVKLRYRSAPVACRVDGALEPGRHRRLELALAEPVAGAAPGQAACLLAGDVVVGWGWISS